MDPDQTAPTRFTLFIYEASNSLVDDKNIHFVIMCFFEGLINVSSVCIRLGFS